MMFLLLILLVVVGWLAYRYIRGRGGKDMFAPKEEEPLEIARRRYARGEITREEFEQIKQDLEKNGREP
jgi:putative membrane protein